MSSWAHRWSNVMLMFAVHMLICYWILFSVTLLQQRKRLDISVECMNAILCISTSKYTWGDGMLTRSHCRFPLNLSDRILFCWTRHILICWVVKACLVIVGMSRCCRAVDRMELCDAVSEARTWWTSTAVQLYILVLTTHCRQSLVTDVRPESEEDRCICLGGWPVGLLAEISIHC